MGNFHGISPKGVQLLAENKFNDSKPFYEEHKEELKNLVTVPMRQIVLDLSETLLNLDDEIYVHPVYTVSRIRRDTRFSKNKEMYRENLWIAFRRNKKTYRNCPEMWFEFFPNRYNIGIGMFADKPAYMDFFRRGVKCHPDEFLKAVKKLERFGKISFEADMYKTKRFTDENKQLEPYLNSKNVCFIYTCNDITDLFSEKIINELESFFSAAAPMYKFLLNIHNEITERGMMDE